MAYRSRPSRSRVSDDEYADYGYARAPRRRTNVSAIIIGIIVAVSAIAVLFKALSGSSELDPEEKRKAIDVARRAVLASLTNDLANFRRTIDEFAPEGLTADMSKTDQYRFKEGHEFGKPSTADDRDWIERQWLRYMSALRQVAENDVKLKTAQDVDALFRSPDVESRGALDRIDVQVVATHGAALTLLLRKKDGEWRVMRWQIAGTYY